MPAKEDTASAEGRLIAILRRDLIKGLGIGVLGATLPTSHAFAATAGNAVSGNGLKAWSDYIEALKPASALIEATWRPDDIQTRAELYRQLVMNIAQGYIWYFQSTPDHPDWMPFENSIFMLQPNPDAVYHVAPVEGRGVYRIVGNRGNTRVMGFATGSGMLGTRAHAQALATGKVGLNNYDADGLTIGRDGSFEVIFSGEKPKDWEGDWRFLDPRAGSILVRQFSYDWGVEQEARFAIERLDTPALKPRLTAPEIGDRLDLLLGDFVRRFSAFVIGYQDSVRKKLGVNVMELTGFEDVGNSPEWPQKYWRCIYDYQPSEALII